MLVIFSELMKNKRTLNLAQTYTTTKLPKKNKTESHNPD